MDKVSYYNFEIEHLNGILLYNSLTDKIFPMSFKEYSVIETLMENLPVFQSEYPLLYNGLKKAGYIIPDDLDEYAFIKFENMKRVFKNTDYHLTINPTLDCNVRCWYCSVVSEGAKHYKERMNNNTIMALIKHIELLAQKRPNKIILDWFGGEPLMYFDEVIKTISDRALAISSNLNIPFRQQITTNAILLNKDMIEYMKQAKFNFFQISIDGNEKRQDLIKRYPNPNKHGTYRDVISNINLLCEIIPNINICLRINYDKKTLKNAIDITNDLSENTKNCITIDFQRVWQIPCSKEMKEMLNLNIEYFKSKGYKTTYWGYRPKNFKSCYADSINHYVINYDGRIFKCSARDYSEKLMIGKLGKNGEILWNNKLLSKMLKNSVFDREECVKCKILPLCMGPCIQKRYDSFINNQAIVCTHNNIELNLSSYIIKRAQTLNLI